MYNHLQWSVSSCASLLPPSASALAWTSQIKEVCLPDPSAVGWAQTHAPWLQVQTSHMQHIPSRGQWGATVHELLASLDPPQQQQEAAPSCLNPREASMAREEFARGGQGSLDDLLEALDGGLQVNWADQSRPWIPHEMALCVPAWLCRTTLCAL